MLFFSSQVSGSFVNQLLVRLTVIKVGGGVRGLGWVGFCLVLGYEIISSPPPLSQRPLVIRLQFHCRFLYTKLLCTVFIRV